MALEGQGSDTVSDPSRVLAVYDPRHEPHLVMTLTLTDTTLDIEPSEEMRRHLEQDLEETHQEAGHLPVIGWMLNKALTFAEHRMADYFGKHNLHRVRMRYDGTYLHLSIGRTAMDLGPGEIDPEAAGAFVATYERLTGRQARS
jgi:hypothetical protein